MDCFFNKCIPESTVNKIILRPIGKTFINGLSPGYEVKYDRSLERLISESEFTYIVENLNEQIVNLWPCCYCFSYGYLFCLCTLGLSFLFPCMCMSEAKTTLLEKIEVINERYFFSKNLRLSYKSKCSTSWLEVEILKPEDLNIIMESGRLETDDPRKIKLTNNQ